MTVRSRVVQSWHRLTHRVRQIIKTRSMRSGNAVSRLRCKVIMGLVRGKSPTQLVRGGSCSESLVDRVAQRSLTEGLQAVADRREDHGGHEVDARYEGELPTVVAGSPQGHGYLRPTWSRDC